MAETFNECVIEWIKGNSRATVTMPPNTRLGNKILKLSEKGSTDIDTFVNKDGTLLAHIPVSWIKITPPRQMSDEQREQMRQRALANFGKEE